MKTLESIRVLDLTHAISGPTCTNMLLQLGAEVVKIEKPGSGDVFRHYTEHAGLPLMSVPFAAINAGKRSVTLDLKQPEAREAVLRLVDRADVLVENYRPGTLERLGLGEAALRARNPRLVYASITGFGQFGPLRDWGAYDHIAQAMSGIAVMNAGAEGPQKIGMPIIDSFSGYLAVIGILAALRRRDENGEGAYLDVSMLDAALKLVNTSVSVYSFTGIAPKGTGNRGFRLVATAEFFETAEGWIALGANQQHQVEAMFEALGHPEMLDDPRFATHAARQGNYDALKTWLVAFFLTQRAEDVEGRLAAAQVPVAMLRDIGQIVEHPHIAGRGILEEVELPGVASPLAVLGPGFDTGSPPDEALPIVPVLGGDTEAVLAEIGYSPAEIERFQAAGAA